MHDVQTLKGLFDEMFSQASEVVNRLAGS